MEAAMQGLEIRTPAATTAETVAGVPCEWIDAEGCREDAVLLYLHGGGYTIGSLRTHRELMHRLGAATEMRVLGVGYRLAPEHPFPAAIEDTSAVYRALLERGMTADKIAIGGDSAGGGLTFATLLEAKSRELPLPAAAVTLSPWVDLTASGDSIRSRASDDPMVRASELAIMADAYLGGAPGDDPLASPVFADLTGLPPTLIQVGAAEILLDDSTHIAERLERAGVVVEIEVWDDLIHVFQSFPSLPEAAEAVDRIGDFVKKYVA